MKKILVLLAALLFALLGTGIAQAAQLQGTKGDDVLVGTAGKDQIQGYGGNDTVYGLEGDDQIQTHEGDDYVDPGSGRDSVQLGDGNDVAYTVDGERDVVQCGRGYDTVIVDKIDVVQDCENVTRV